MTDSASQEHLEVKPGASGDEVMIAGRSISAKDIAVWHVFLGASVREIAERHNLTPAEVHAALAYYYDHQQEIDQTVDITVLREALREQPRAERTRTPAAEMPRPSTLHRSALLIGWLVQILVPFCLIVTMVVGTVGRGVPFALRWLGVSSDVADIAGEIVVGLVALLVVLAGVVFWLWLMIGSAPQEHLEVKSGASGDGKALRERPRAETTKATALWVVARIVFAVVLLVAALMAAFSLCYVLPRFGVSDNVADAISEVATSSVLLLLAIVVWLWLRRRMRLSHSYFIIFLLIGFFPSMILYPVLRIYGMTEQAAYETARLARIALLFLLGVASLIWMGYRKQRRNSYLVSVEREIMSAEREIAEISGRYDAPSKESLYEAIQERRVAEHPAWEDYVVWKDKEAHIAQLRQMAEEKRRER